MFFSRRANKRINKLHKGTLRLVYDDHETSFSDLLAKDGSFPAQHTSIQTLLFDMDKIKHNLSESCLKDLFSAVYGNYNRRSQSDIGVPSKNEVFSGHNQLSILNH